MRFPTCVLVLSILVPVVALAAPETLKFNPPDSVNFTVKAITIRDQWIDTLHRVADSTFTTVSSKLQRQPSGYELTSIQTAYSGNRNSVPFDKSMIRVMSGFKTVLTLDSNGEATSIGGYEGLFNRIDSMADKTTADALKEALSPRLMADRDLNDWNDRMSYLVGRKLALMALKYDTSPLILPDDASLQLHEVSFIRDTVRTNGRLFATVRVFSDTDPSRLADSLHQDVKFVKDLFKLPDSAVALWTRSISRFQAVTDLVIDVQTLLVQREHATRHIVMKQVDLPEQKVITQVAEATDRTFTYSK